MQLNMVAKTRFFIKTFIYQWHDDQKYCFFLSFFYTKMKIILCTKQGFFLRQIFFWVLLFTSTARGLFLECSFFFCKSAHLWFSMDHICFQKVKVQIPEQKRKSETWVSVTSWFWKLTIITCIGKVTFLIQYRDS